MPTRPEIDIRRRRTSRGRGVMTVAVYGATGFLGRLVAGELSRRGAAFTLCGRDAAKLEAQSAALAGAPWRVAPVDRPDRLRKMLDGCGVVINCAAPSHVCGRPVLDAALESGVHYVDAAGEQPFIRHLFETYDDRARRLGLAVVPAMGFDYAVGDCLARLTASGRGPAREVLIAYALRGPGVGHTGRSALARPHGVEVVYRDGRWQPVRHRIERRSFVFPEPFGRQPVARHGSGEVITVPRHTRTRSVVTLLMTRALVPSALLVPLFPVLRPMVALALSSPLRPVAARAMSWVPRGRPRADASAQVEPACVVAVRVEGEDGSTAHGLFRGTDFHAITASVLVHGALRVAGIRPGRGGVLPPSVAVEPDALLDHLAADGAGWRTSGPSGGAL